MTQTQLAELLRLREIGWDEWDPIGLKETDCPRDEYDAYLIEAVRRFSIGQSVPEVANYLSEIASQHMGLGACNPASSEADERAAASIEAYLASRMTLGGSR